MTSFFLNRKKFQNLIISLQSDGYKLIGPKLKDDAIVYDEVHTTADFPLDIQDEQAPGRYKLKKTGNGRWFSWANGPQNLKPFLFTPREYLWKATRKEKTNIDFTQTIPAPEHLAMIGVRACDLAALELQDKHFLQGEYQDPYYKARRENMLIVAVGCTHSAETCFCVSTGDGPEVKAGFDLSLLELDNGFIITSGSEQGQKILDQLHLNTATEQQLLEARHQIEYTAKKQTRTLPGRNLRDSLFEQLDHPQWQKIAERCLSCGNCTAVCPTCFCHSEHDDVTLDAKEISHYRQWSSCFTQEHSYMHGLVVRAETKFRYRQWLTHKLGSWHDQYGRSGCVGCGRCITWCPASIDFTEEVNVICGEGCCGESSCGERNA